MTNTPEPRTLPEALAALRRALQERDNARAEANKYYNALEAALARHSATRLSVEVVGFTAALESKPL